MIPYTNRLPNGQYGYYNQPNTQWNYCPCCGKPTGGYQPNQYVGAPLGGLGTPSGGLNDLSKHQPNQYVGAPLGGLGTPSGGLNDLSKHQHLMGALGAVSASWQQAQGKI